MKGTAHCDVDCSGGRALLSNLLLFARDSTARTTKALREELWSVSRRLWKFSVILLQMETNNPTNYKDEVAKEGNLWNNYVIWHNLNFLLLCLTPLSYCYWISCFFVKWIYHRTVSQEFALYWITKLCFKHYRHWIISSGIRSNRRRESIALPSAFFLDFRWRTSRRRRLMLLPAPQLHRQQQTTAPLETAASAVIYLLPLPAFSCTFP